MTEIFFDVIIFLERGQKDVFDVIIFLERGQKDGVEKCTA